MRRTTAHIDSRQFVAWGSAASLGVSFGAQAQAYANKPITLLVPFAPGGNIGVLARCLEAAAATAMRVAELRSSRSAPS